jgi:hypothetical protein
MSKLDDLRKQLETIESEIKKLSDFRDTPFLKRFRRQLEGERSFFLDQISKLTSIKESKEHEHLQRIQKANQNRSSKMKRNWNYYKDIQKNYYPDKSLKEIRRLHKLHRQGLETDISDVAWRNPSP